ncbi:MAG: response regulator [Candidatus Riflebacteria bacterium]|nr:response regulator [Candidatus Riflebacteria bacterium]
MTFKLKALIADDSRVMRKILKDILIKENFDVVAEAANGDEAVALCKEHMPNLLTLDIAMPGKDGIQTLKEVKLISNDIKVVMITSNDKHDIILEALKLGADNYITKPYEPEKVARVINCIEY